MIFKIFIKYFSIYISFIIYNFAPKIYTYLDEDFLVCLVEQIILVQVLAQVLVQMLEFHLNFLLEIFYF